MAGQRPIRIAGCSGSASDRRDALSLIARNVADDPLDVIIGDWMSELNMVTRGVSKTDQSGEPAFEPTFVESLKPALTDLAKHNVKLIVNAGASDTEKLHAVVTSMCRETSIDLKVAWISGDEVMPAVHDALTNNTTEFKNIYTDEKLADWKFKPIYAQAYLGGMGIATALENGADIVLCGRVADASLTVGAAAWWHKWTREHQDELANALIAGHLIECSSYVTGGNFTGFKKLSGWQDIGYPIAEIYENGQVIVTKTKGSGGQVSVDTCTSQLLYEIQGPLYFNSDVVAVLDNITFEQRSQDRVILRGVKGSLPPPTTKVGITAKGGYQAEAHWFIVGLDVKEKAQAMETLARKLLKPYIPNFSLLEFSVNGSSPENPRDQNSATVDFRILAQAEKAEHLASKKFARPCIDGVMAAYPGATPQLDLRTALPRPIYEYFVSLIPQDAIDHKTHMPWRANDASTVSIAAPEKTKTYPSKQRTTPGKNFTRSSPRARGGTTDAAGGWAELPAQVGRSVIREVFGPWGRTVRGPLGWIVHARSGDKGSDCNVGFWVRHQSEYEWLRNTLSENKIKHLLGVEYKHGKDVERFEFPGLRAVHFLLREHLDRGVGCTKSYDILGKNCAEYLRAKWVDLPVKFLERGKI